MAKFRYLYFIFVMLITHVLPNDSYVLDDSSGLGRTFDGIGGLSGGGATSKLLVNYPEPQRSQILDYLFKPNFGASLHILKVEICGDSQAGEGTESSHMHNATDENYNRGYEWWLMKEAKTRNPSIKLYGLPWAFPGWLGKGTGSPYSYPNMTATYILKWIQGAKYVHGLDIDYIGVWNEKQYNIKYIETLRQNLDENGFTNIQLVAADGSWDISKDINKDAQLSKSVDIIGVHYPGTKSTTDAILTSKTLWSSEDYSTFNDNVGAGCWARILNQNYVNGHMTSTISWNLIAAYYPNLPFSRCGLMTAEEPWSGNYVVANPIWITAHTTQFTKPGMKYLKHGSGVGMLDKGGSYVSFVDPNDPSKFTLVIETMSHDHSICIRPNLPAFTVTNQTAMFQLKGNLAKITTLNGRYSKLGFDGSASRSFVKTFNMKVDSSGTFSVPLDVDEIITLTTVSEGNKGVYSDVPVSKPFPVPYSDTFDQYPLNTEAANFVPQIGVWEVCNSSMRSHFPASQPPPHHKTKNQANTQVLTEKPILWCDVPDIPINLGGSYNWSNVFISVDIYIPQNSTAKGAFIAARVDQGGCNVGKAKGLFFWLFMNTKSYSLTTDLMGTSVLISGSLEMFFPGQPMSASLVVYNNHAVGSIGQGTLFSAEIPPSMPTNGFVGYGTTNFGIVEFDNFYVDKSA